MGSSKRDQSNSPAKPRKKSKDEEDDMDEESEEETPSCPKNLNESFEAATVDTTANKQYVDLAPLFEDPEDLQRAKIPFTTFLGEDDTAFHDSEAKMLRLLGKLHYGTDQLNTAQLKEVKTTGIDSLQLIVLLTKVVTEPASDEITQFLNPSEVVDLLVITCRLAHTEPKVMGRVKRSAMPNTLHARLWFGAKMTLGSYYNKERIKKQTNLRNFLRNKKDSVPASEEVSKNKSPTDKQTDVMELTNNTEEENSTSTTSNSDKTNAPNTAVTPSPNPYGRSRSYPQSTSNKTDLGKDKHGNPCMAIGNRSLKADKASAKLTLMTRVQLKIPIKADPKKSAPEVLLATLKDLYSMILRTEPSVIILPWRNADMPKYRAITSPDSIPSNKMSDFKPYSTPARPKNGSDVWIKMHFAHDGQSVHLTSLNGSDTAYWFDDHNASSFEQCVKGSDDVVRLAAFVYSGDFLNPKNIQKFMQAELGSKVIIGLRSTKNKEVSMSNKNDTRRPWALKEDKMIYVECDRSDLKTVKTYLYKRFHPKIPRSKRLGGYNIRILPEPDAMRLGSAGDKDRIKILRKHVALMKSIGICKNDEIIELDEVPPSGTPNLTLRQLLLAIPYPIGPINEDDYTIPANSLFYSVDNAPGGQDRDRGIIYLTAYNDRMQDAERFLDILPAFIQENWGTQAVDTFLAAGSFCADDQVDFHNDEDGNWKGTWTTQEDSFLQDILQDETMGKITVEFDDIDILNRKEPVLLNSDDASCQTFGKNMFGRDGPSQPQGSQQADSVVPAAQAAARE
ncbi:MAG: hypothetical protein SGARI_000192, partial [Bacillariaceae sp.]